MDYYNKIDTLFKRDSNFKIIPGEFTRPEFALLDRWSVTEKIDGTSTWIRFGYEDGDVVWSFGGRTANANLPSPVENSLIDTVHAIHPAANDLMDRFGLDSLTVYGESYGPKINGGGNYSNDVEFRAFDVRANDLWLSPADFYACVAELQIDTAPNLGMYDLDAIIAACRDGFGSTFAIRPVQAEGIIAKSPVELTNNAGKRLMFKLKTRDF